MRTLVLDSHALLTYFERQPGWETVAGILRDASEEKCELKMPLINWGEVYYVTLREYGDVYANKILEVLDQMPIEIIHANRKLTLQAAVFKATGGISYADCFVAALAMEFPHAMIVTGDKEFKRLEHSIKIHWLR